MTAGRTDRQGNRNGTIVTFYSYKGGTGRSMLLANVAWILASAGQKVLAIDWDLEAPGLHRYFHPFMSDPGLASTEGLIDFFTDYAVQALTPAPPTGPPEPDIARYGVSLNYSSFPKKGLIDFVPAGQQGSAYATRVNSFDWDEFYARLGGRPFLQAVREKVRAEYDYVLIDSRTGVSDTSGICTIEMPDILVVCFTLNTQSIEGAAAVAESVRSQRDITVFPVPCRVELAEKEKLERRRDQFQSRFSATLSTLDSANRESYWGQVEVLYQPFYAYEEVLATVADRPNRPTSVLAAMERITGFLTGGTVRRTGRMPATERTRVLARYAGLPPADAESQTAADLGRLVTEQERVIEELSADKPPRASVSGEVMGQVAVGTNLIQPGPDDGGVVYVAAPGQLTIRRRSPPVRLIGRRPAKLVDRRVEVELARSSAAANEPVEFFGPPGSGKTALLQHMVYDQLGSAGREVVYHQCRGEPVEDTLQFLYEAFFESEVPVKPAGSQLQRYLQNVEAFIALDDIRFDRQDVSLILDTMPLATFQFAAEVRHLFGFGRSISVGGLPPDAAAELFVQTLGRQLVSGETSDVHRLVTALSGHPLQIVLAAALATETLRAGGTLSDLIGPLTAGPYTEKLQELLLAQLDGNGRAVLDILAALDGVAMSAEQLAELTGVPDIRKTLRTLVRLGLVSGEPDG